MNRYLLSAMFLLSVVVARAQFEEQVRKAGPIDLKKGVEYQLEMQGSFSGGKTPLWLNANKHGLSSLETTNGYLRGSIIRSLSTDDGRKWGVGYGVDVAVPVNYTSNVVVQQAYVEGRWLKGVLSIGSKERQIELKNDSLSSGSQTLGKNARPVPQVRLALQDYWTVPLTRGWLHLKGHLAFGRMTDQNWQHDFTHREQKYADDVLYHSKAGYLKIGNEDVFCPWSFEIGLEMATLFGGTSYQPTGIYKGGTGIKDFVRAFIPGGNDVTEDDIVYKNAEGNHLGSWVARIGYDADTWSMGVYADKYFEDHSSMLQLDYNGYGSGEEWNTKKTHRYFLYDFKDWMFGIDYSKKYDSWLQAVVFEYLYTKYQSGPVYHDHTEGWSEHISGRDNFYNHHIYTGWQHWGQVIGNPLYRSPLYNDDGKIMVKDNRFMAFHLGVSGHPSDLFSYRLLCTWQEGLGTYDNVYSNRQHNLSFLLEGTCYVASKRKWLNNTQVRAGYGMDFGKLLGGINYGFQLTISKTGLIKL